MQDFQLGFDNIGEVGSSRSDTAHANSGAGLDFVPFGEWQDGGDMAAGRPVVQDKSLCLVEIVAAFLEEDDRSFDQYRVSLGLRSLVRQRAYFGERR